ncbi:MAG: hypothetical protein ACF788_01190 [Novipirellula sp. JB048]
MARTLEDVNAADLAGGGGLQAEGKFHFIVEDITDGKETKSGSMLNGLFAKCKVLHGEHEGSTFTIEMLDPTMNSSDGGAFARKKQAAFLIAANVLTPAQVNGGVVSYDEQLARGSQIIAEIRLGRENDNGKRYLELHYSNVYHVDDPRVADVPKSEEILSVIPANHRHKGDNDFFGPMIGARKSSTQPSGGSATSAAEPNFDGI